MNRPPRRRRGGPTIVLLVDLVRQASWTRSWAVTFAVVLTLIAAIALVVGQTVLAWAIYPAL